MNVTYIDHMGSDLTVVNAARVSFNNHKTELDAKDIKLLVYLAQHKHWSPFAHPQLQLRVSAPIFVARQLAKHQIGASWNEVSRRYVTSRPEFYLPDIWRQASADKKQGSLDDSADVDLCTLNRVDDLMTDSLYLYEELIRHGVCAEQARMILPQNMYTEWYWTGSLYFFSRVCQERLAEDSQAETRKIATAIQVILELYFPESTKALLSVSEIQ